MTDLKWEIYTDAAGEWRWRATYSNGRIGAASSEGYNLRESCVKNAVDFGYNPKLQTEQFLAETHTT